MIISQIRRGFARLKPRSTNKHDNFSRPDRFRPGSAGNVGFQNKKTTYHHDESVSVKTTALVDVIADLLKVRQEVLMAALTFKRARVAGEVVVINYRMQEVSVTRSTVAKLLWWSISP